MKIKFLYTAFFFILCNITLGQTAYQKDFNEFWNVINDNYAYLSEQKIDWLRVKEIYEPRAAEIINNYEFIQFLESVLNELHNGHSSLNTNLDSSNRVIPSGQDVYVEKINDKFYLTDIRKGFGAEQSGLKIGMEIILFNGKSIEEQLKRFLPVFTQNHSPQMYQYSIDMLFAGAHNVKREISAAENGNANIYFPDNYERPQADFLLESKILNQNTVCIKINNSLGNNQLIFDFDAELDKYLGYENIVIDLTETPSGGNTTVARAIIGRFIEETLPYQKHEYDEKQYETKRVWTEYAIPRKTQFKGSVFILVGHWTGSMGEGIATGFEGIKRGTVIGTRMAGLIGAISNFQLPETNIGYQFPTERLYHINDTPREMFKPNVLTKNIEETYIKMKEIR